MDFSANVANRVNTATNSLAYKTLITQEMMSVGYLAGNSVYVCTEHTDEIVSGYSDELDNVFKIRWAVFNKHHIKQEPEKIASAINKLPVQLYFSVAIKIHGIPKIVVHA